MTSNLPAYLQNKPVTRRVAEAATAGIGASLPPHISIQGNAFTLIDAAGSEQSIGAILDCCIVDVCDVVAKRYYGGKKWTPDSNDPPVCWSSNGVGPSRDAIEPPLLEEGPSAGQVVRTCAECPKNERGSAVSQLSGAAIKACRDEKLLAVLIPQYPTVLFQLVLTPGSFSPKDVTPPASNWRDYLKRFEGQAFDLNDVITRIAFQPKANGVLTFQGIAHLSDQSTINQRNNALVEKKTDVLVGRLDRLRDASLALPAPAPVVPLSTTAALQTMAKLSADVDAVSTTPAFPSDPPNGGQVQGNGGQAPANGRRRGRKPAGAVAESGQANPPSGGQTAPFMPAASPVVATQAGASAGTAGGGGFGISPGVAPNAELSAALDSVFGTR